MFFFFSSRRRHTRCALVTGVQTCALPILELGSTAKVRTLITYLDIIARLCEEQRRLGPAALARTAETGDPLSRWVAAHLIVPVVAKRAVDLAPAPVLGAQILFWAFFGILALFLADPIVAMIKVIGRAHFCNPVTNAHIVYL